MEIIEGIHRVDEASANMAHSNVYLIESEKKLTVIDTGTPGNAKKIVDYIQKIGHQSDDVVEIILTHFHLDHAGSVRELKEFLPNARIAVHEADCDYVEGRKPLPKPRNVLFRAFSPFIKFEPVQVDDRLKDQDTIDMLKVIHTPGHTPGSICLLHERQHVLFAGDTLRFDGEKIALAPEHFTLDPFRANESVGKISPLEFEIMLPGHGEPLKTMASETVKKFYNDMRSGPSH